MRFFNVLIFILFINFSFSQTFKLKEITEKTRGGTGNKKIYSVIDNELDSNGYYVKHGNYKELYKKTEVVNGQYNIGQKEGAWMYKDPEGEYMQKGTFKAGKKIGEWTSYLKGVLNVTEIYNEKGKLISLNRFDGEKNLIEYYDYDSIKKISLSKYFIDDNYKREITKTDDNKVHLKLFYPNGKLVQEKKFYQEKLIYASAIYNNIGQALIPSTINGGNGILQTIYLDELTKGIIANKSNITYLNGIPNGNFEAYNFDGKLVTQGNYSQGEKKGQWKTWSTKKKSYIEKKYKIKLKQKKAFKASSVNFKNHHFNWSNQVKLSLMKKKKGNRVEVSRNDFSKMVNKSITKNLDTKKLAKYINKGKKGIYRIGVIFKIDDLGEISDIKVKSRSKSKFVKGEIERALNKLPTLIPASQNSKFVNLLFSLPIVFRME